MRLPAIVVCLVAWGCARGDGRVYVFAPRNEHGDIHRFTVEAPPIAPAITQGLYGRVYHKPAWTDMVGGWAAGQTVHVQLFPEHGRLGPVKTVDADENGFYQMELAPGRYIVSSMDLSAVARGGRQAWEEVKRSGTPVKTVEVTENEVTECNFSVRNRP